MANYRKRALNEPQTSTPLEPLRGRQLMRRDRASAVHATGDRVLSHGRRILATVGLHGAKRWHIPEGVTIPFSGYPDSATARPSVRTPALPLTPGHFVRVVVVANPSGLTRQTDTFGSLISGGAKGEIKIDVTYNNGSSKTVTKTIAIPGSVLSSAAEPSGDGAAWGALRRFRTSLFRPADLSVPANLAAWSHDVTVSVQVSYVGSPRAIDVTVYEEPLALGYNLASGGWIAPMHAADNGANLGQLVGPVPAIKRSATDPGGGVEIVMDAAARLGQETGPVLFFASAWDEGNQLTASTETDYRSISGTAYKELVSGASSTFSAAYVGWSASSGANARRVQESESTTVLRDKDNVVPVRCYVYGAMSTTSGSPTATVRFETATYSVAQVSIPVGIGFAWRSATGHLRCGLGAQDPAVLQVRARCSTDTGSPAFRWRYIMVVYENL